MQRHCTELTERLLNSLDKEYNVVDMGGVVDVITILEKTTITKEVLEITRLGKHINELRRKTSNNALAKRAKELVRRWRETCLPSAHSTPQPTPADTAPPALNGAKPHSPALRGFKPNSPVLKGLKPESPLLKDATALRVISPALSMHSDHSRSPNASAIKQSITMTSNHRLSVTESVSLSENQNHPTEAVPRTHSSNKRLRKDEAKEHHQQHRHRHQSMQKQHQQQQQHGPESASINDNESLAKRQRLNGENISGNLNSQVPSPTYKERISEYYVESSEPDGVGAEPKKRGRKKGSKSAHKQPLPEDRVKEKLASISRNPKLKTTQELLADLQARGSSSGVAPTPSQTTGEPPSTEEILRGSSSEQGSKIFRAAAASASSSLPMTTTTTTTTSATNLAIGSHRNTSSETARSRLADNCLDPPAKRRQEAAAAKLEAREKDSRTASEKKTEPRQLTVEEILAKLPPLDPASIVWSEDEDEETAKSRDEAAYEPREVTEEDLERLHSQFVEGLNGNFQPKLSSLTSSPEEEKKEVSRRTGKEGAASTTGRTTNGVDAYSQSELEFREWHEMLGRPSYDGQILHILPYVIID